MAPTFTCEGEVTGLDVTNPCEDPGLGPRAQLLPRQPGHPLAPAKTHFAHLSAVQHRQSQSHQLLWKHQKFG